MFKSKEPDANLADPGTDTSFIDYEPISNDNNSEEEIQIVD